jgi:hypothetical protein
MKILFGLSRNNVLILTGKSRKGYIYSCAYMYKETFLNALAAGSAYADGLLSEKLLNTFRVSYDIFGSADSCPTVGDFSHWTRYDQRVESWDVIFEFEVKEHFTHALWREACVLWSGANKSYLGLGQQRFKDLDELRSFFHIHGETYAERELAILVDLDRRAKMSEQLLVYKNSPDVGWQEKKDPREWTISETVNCFENEFRRWLISHDSRSDNRRAVLKDLRSRGFLVDHMRSNVFMDMLMSAEESSRLWSYTGD